MKIYLTREGDTFKPLSVMDYEKTRRVKEGQIIEVDYKKPRNPLFHNKFMSMIRVVYDNQEKYETIEQVLNAVKVDLGYYDPLYVHNVEVAVPRSISFAKMDEIEFEELYDKAVTLILARYLPTVERHELERYVNEIARYAG